MRRAAVLIAVVLAAMTGGCALGDDDDDERSAAPKRAASPRQFAERFAALTGVPLKVVPGDPLGTRLDEPEEPDRFVRFGLPDDFVAGGVRVGSPGRRLRRAQAVARREVGALHDDPTRGSARPRSASARSADPAGRR